jgi:hypothetical protein
MYITHKMWKYSLPPKEMASNHRFYFGKFSSLGQKKKVQNDSYKRHLWKKGWSEPAATNAPVEDEPVQPVLRMNILPARRDFFFHLLSAPKFSTSPPPTYHLPTPPPLIPSPELQRPWAAVERELELWLWSGSWSGWSWSWNGWSWSGTHAPSKR